METIDDGSSNPAPAKVIWTVGHSTHSLEEFKEILRAHRIKTLVDVRSFPSSRRYPHFNKEAFGQTLREVNVEYLHLPGLGGRRRPSAESRNTAWRNVSFRAYADYMETDMFMNSVEALMELAVKGRTAIMCAEAVWWRCHRSLIADYLKVNGWSVIHILGTNKTEAHPYTSAAMIVEGKLSYRGLFDE